MSIYSACPASSKYIYLDAGTEVDPDWVAECPLCSGAVKVHPTGVGSLRIERHDPAYNLHGRTGVHCPECYAQPDPDECICAGADLLEPV